MWVTVAAAGRREAPEFKLGTRVLCGFRTTRWIRHITHGVPYTSKYSIWCNRVCHKHVPWGICSVMVWALLCWDSLFLFHNQRGCHSVLPSVIVHGHRWFEISPVCVWFCQQCTTNRRRDTTVISFFTETSMYQWRINTKYRLNQSPLRHRKGYDVYNRRKDLGGGPYTP